MGPVSKHRILLRANFKHNATKTPPCMFATLSVGSCAATFTSLPLYLCVNHPKTSINPSAPEFNPSAQRCLPRFLLGTLIF
jgi:hypothetical protein